MMNDKDYAKLVNKVADIFASSTGANATEKKLAKFILSNFYGCDTFFLNREGDLSSGIYLEAVKIFSENMVHVIGAINGERN